MSKIFTIVGGVIFILLVGGGAFYSGVVYERSQATDAQAAFFAERGDGFGGFGDPDHQAGLGGFGQRGEHADDQNAFPGQAGFGRSAAGQVKSIEGDTLLLSTPQDVTTVVLTEQTAIVRFVAVERDDLQPEQRVTVIGQRNEAGEIIATSIQILAESP